MREVFDSEGHVGVAQEFLVFVAVRVEGRGDESVRSQHRAYPAGKLGLGPRHAAHAHGAVQAEIGAVELAAIHPLGRLDLRDHLADEPLIGLLRHPPRPCARARPQRRFDADQLDLVVLARDLHETAHVGLWIEGQQRFAAGGRSLIKEILDRGVVLQERHSLVGEMQDGDADRFAAHALPCPCVPTKGKRINVPPL